MAKKYAHRFKLQMNEEVLKKTIKRCQERQIVIPTLAEQKDPNKLPEKVKSRLKGVGLWDVNPINLFRITWKNDTKTGQFGGVNVVEIPSIITGVKARIFGIVGEYFPTGAHKVGAAFGCLVPRLVTGEFDPSRQRAVWPSTGNYCRGGAFDCALLACDAIAILPENMSKERFKWLHDIGTKEVIATPGCESNVKEIYDKCWELRKERKTDIVIFNQFEEWGNHNWHYTVTAAAIEEAFKSLNNPKLRLAGYSSATGSAGTLAAGDYLKEHYPNVRVIANEALQCPTLYNNGFGDHRIEGIGDKHIPWIHNARNTDMVAAIDDEACMRIIRLFNEPAGREALKKAGVPQATIEQLPRLGISSVCNMLAAIKAAKYYEFDENDCLFMPFTDPVSMYHSRLEELNKSHGAYTETQAMIDWERRLMGADVDHLEELTFVGKKRIHNLKYYTWVEQQGKTYEEIQELWDPDFWNEVHAQVPEWERLIQEFNQKTGVLAKW